VIPRISIAAALAVALTACGGGRSTPPDPCAFDQPGAPWLAFASNQAGNADLWLTRLDGTCRTQVTTETANDLDPAWLGPNELGFFSMRVAGIGLYRHAFSDGAESGIPLAGPEAATSPAWNGDRSLVAFEGVRASIAHSEIWAAPGNGGDATNLTLHSETYNDAAPIWSPDGSKIYFVSTRPIPGTTRIHTQIWVMGADGTSPTQVTAGGSDILGRPAISPDGKKLAFSRSDGTRPVIYVRDLTSGDELPISNPNAGDQNSDSDPAFDATGARIAVSRVHGSGSPAIWIIDAADGANAVQVTTPASGVVDGQPAFRPE
jgi:Tol biopolymer transport system component